MEIILKAKNIFKNYPGVTALEDVSFNVYKGKVNVLVGENGAGKSTLMKILAGVEKQTSGDMILNNKILDINSTKDAEKNSIGIIHQELNLFPNLTVHENIFMGHEISNYFTINTKKQKEITKNLMRKLNQAIKPDDVVENLRIGQQQIVEIAKALAKNTKILIMDEPSSALSKNEVSVLYSVIEGLKKEGVSIIYISHKLEEIMKIGDIITILRDSKLICEELIEKVNIPWITEKMVGMKNFKSVNIAEPNVGKNVIEANSIFLKKKSSDELILDNVSFNSRAGEILSLYGLMGSGRTELLEVIMGLNNNFEGSIKLENKILKKSSIAARINDGIVLVPEDRQGQGLIQCLSILSNILLSKISRSFKGFYLNSKKETTIVKKSIEYLGIKVSSYNNLITSLSGGNQQKVVVAKALETNPKLLMLDEPTRGIDVGAKQEIFYIMKKLSEKGISIIFVSSEIKEVLAVADRVLVLAKGKITKELKSIEITEDNLVKFSQG
ncbi:MAG: Ribose import ATP-binding protein RbsA [Alphaproteobacteria bacterium MarineAlpha5_Bin11]|nr:sugar ABC transporter ATP-binding protein [Pelagibacteraceae bacterium]PPR44188.1 MAG: Ribose import ATP-binding protein RbsA [Alphaproteobacteria bacterium MarineAlpha5_Bin11]